MGAEAFDTALNTNGVGTPVDTWIVCPTNTRAFDITGNGQAPGPGVGGVTFDGVSFYACSGSANVVGGAILSQSANLLVHSSAFFMRTAAEGIADMSCYSSDLDCICFPGSTTQCVGTYFNDASGPAPSSLSGGAIASIGGSLTVGATVFWGMGARYGGALALFDGCSAHIFSSLFWNNHAYDRVSPSGVWPANLASVPSVLGEASSGGGAAVFVARSFATLEGNSFVNNSCGGAGGAIALVDNSQASADETSVDDNIFVRNTANIGAAVFADNSHLEMRGSQAHLNFNPPGGSSIFHFTSGSIVEMLGSQIYNNTGPAVRVEAQSTVNMTSCNIQQQLSPSSSVAGGLSCSEATVINLNNHITGSFLTTNQLSRNVECDNCGTQCTSCGPCSLCGSCVVGTEDSDACSASYMDIACAAQPGACTQSSCDAWTGRCKSEPIWQPLSAALTATSCGYFSSPDGAQFMSGTYKNPTSRTWDLDLLASEADRQIVLNFETMVIGQDDTISIYNGQPIPGTNYHRLLQTFTGPHTANHSLVGSQNDMLVVLNSATTIERAGFTAVYYRSAFQKVVMNATLSGMPPSVLSQPTFVLNPVPPAGDAKHYALLAAEFEQEVAHAINTPHNLVRCVAIDASNTSCSITFEILSTTVEVPPPDAKTPMQQALKLQSMFAEGWLNNPESSRWLSRANNLQIIGAPEATSEPKKRRLSPGAMAGIAVGVVVGVVVIAVAVIVFRKRRSHATRGLGVANDVELEGTTGL